MSNALIENDRDDVYELGTWIGRRQAFAAIAGSCSAADAESLRQVRNRKQYRALGMSWKEFCQERVGIDRKTAEQIIHRLEEFGPQYFTLAQVTGVTPEQYRRLAASVSEKGLLYAGEAIPIAAENASRLSAAVEELRRVPKPATREKEANCQDQAFEKVERLLTSAVDGIARLQTMSLDGEQSDRLSSIIIAHLKRLGIVPVTRQRTRP
jgi:hypothetical protein